MVIEPPAPSSTHRRALSSRSAPIKSPAIAATPAANCRSYRNTRQYRGCRHSYSSPARPSSSPARLSPVTCQICCYPGHTALHCKYKYHVTPPSSHAPPQPPSPPIRLQSPPRPTCFGQPQQQQPTEIIHPGGSNRPWLCYSRQPHLGSGEDAPLPNESMNKQVEPYKSIDHINIDDGTEMLMPGFKRKTNAAAAARAKLARTEALKEVEPAVLPTVHVGINTDATGPAAGATSGAAADAGGSVLATSTETVPTKHKKPAKTKPAAAEKSKAASDSQGDEPSETGKKSKRVVVVEDDPPSSNMATSDMARPLPAGQEGGPPISSIPLHQMHLDKTFCEHPEAPGWASTMRRSLTAVPPLPNLVQKWPKHAMLAVGEGLARRVATDAAYLPEMNTMEYMENAIADFGFASHAISNSLFAAQEGVRRTEARELQLSTQLAAFKKAIDEKTLDVETARKLTAEKEESMAKAQADWEARLKDAEEKLESIEARLSAETQACQIAEEKARVAEEKAKTAEEKATAALTRAETAESQVASAIKDFKRTEDYMKPATACFEQGIYHMARCWLRAAEEKKSMSLKDLAGCVMENSFSETLLKYHSVVPFREAEIAYVNKDRRDENLPEIEFPPVVTPNLRTHHEELCIKEQEAADEAAEAEDAAKAARKTSEADITEQHSEDAAKTDETAA